MPEGDNTGQQQSQSDGSGQQQQQQGQGQPQGGTGQQQATTQSQGKPPWERDGQQFDPERAWSLIQSLRSDLDAEKSKRTDAERKVGEADTANKSQLDAIAKALGFKDEQKPDDLAAQLSTLQEQFSASQRRTAVLELAAEYEIPKDYQHLLTATDHDALVEQAKGVGELVKAKNQADSTPTFQSNPGQGQGGGTATLAEQMAAAQAEGDKDKVAQLKTQQLMELRNAK